MGENMTREKAFEIFQLDPSTPTAKIKLKYENFMRRAKFDDSLDEVLITKAFDTIMGIDWGNFEADPAYSEKGLNKKKIENFFYHNKRSLIYGIAAFVLIAATILMIVTGKAGINFPKETINIMMAPKAKKPQVKLELPIKIVGTFKDFDWKISRMGLVGSVISYVASPVTVPVKRLFVNQLPRDGKNACLQAWRYVEKVRVKDADENLSAHERNLKMLEVR